MTTRTPPTRTRRDERLGFRLDAESKALIERAARLERRKLSDFCVATLTDTARRTIAEHEVLALSDRDRRSFFEVLVRPPAPSPALRRALEQHERRVQP